MKLAPVSRRSFLGGTAVATAAMVVAPGAAAQRELVIHGDGRQDDTEALQALFDGRQVRVAGSDVVACGKGGTVRLLNGDFLVSRPLRMRAATGLYVGHCTFRLRDGGAAPYPPLEQVG